MKISNKSKFISVLIGAAMCPMVLPTAAFAAGAGAASDGRLRGTSRDGPPSVKNDLPAIDFLREAPATPST